MSRWYPLGLKTEQRTRVDSVSLYYRDAERPDALPAGL